MLTLSRFTRSRTARLGFVAALSLIVFSALPLVAQQTPDLYRGVSFREIGPTTRSGRFVDFAVVEATPRIFYAANATGGVYKTENGGTSYTQVFDSPTVASVGAVALVAIESRGRLHRHRRGEQLAQLVLGRWRVSSPPTPAGRGRTSA